MIPAEKVTKAVREVRDGLSSWRIWWLLGIGDIRQRYSRSRAGQFWITLSMAIFVSAIGSVNAVLFKQSVRDFIPYLAVNYIVWTLISGIITDSAIVFTQAESFLRQTQLPKTVFVMRLLVRNLVSFAHNLIIVPIVFLIMAYPPSWTWLLAPFGLVLIIVAGFFTALMLGILCTRFRDLPQIVQNITQVAFFVTPVMWPANAMRLQFPELINFNPMAAFLHIVAEPLRGIVPSASTYIMALSTIFLLAAISLPLFAQFRARIVYWL
jgi:ABC-type polysaccharide/polyol phosphate export permease